MFSIEGLGQIALWEFPLGWGSHINKDCHIGKYILGLVDSTLVFGAWGLGLGVQSFVSGWGLKFRI